jgi:hypothetical protein
LSKNAIIFQGATLKSASADFRSAGFAFETFAGVGLHSVFDGRALGPNVKENVFAAEGIFLAEREADPVVWEHKAGARSELVSDELYSVHVADFLFGIFGALVDGHCGRDGLAIAYAGFHENAVSAGEG